MDENVDKISLKIDNELSEASTSVVNSEDIPVLNTKDKEHVNIAKNSDTIPDDPVWPCRFCDDEFKTTKELIDHVPSHIGKRICFFPCAFCVRRLYSQKTLNEHQAKHLADIVLSPFGPIPPEEEEENPDQDEEIEDDGELTSDLVLTGQVWTCRLCKAQFNTTKELTDHFPTHKGNRILYFPCAFCPKKLFAQKSLDRHQSFHTAERPFACDHCDKKFITQEHLDVHIQNYTRTMKKRDLEQEETESFTCSLCKVDFYSKEELVVHENKHAEKKGNCDPIDYQWNGENVRKIRGNKRFACFFCPLAYKLRDRLFNHVMRKHPENEMYFGLIRQTYSDMDGGKRAYKPKPGKPNAKGEDEAESEDEASSETEVEAGIDELPLAKRTRRCNSQPKILETVATEPKPRRGRPRNKAARPSRSKPKAQTVPKPKRKYSRWKSKSTDVVEVLDPSCSVITIDSSSDDSDIELIDEVSTEPKPDDEFILP